MGLLNKASSRTGKRETEAGGAGLLAKAGQYAGQEGGEGVPRSEGGEDVSVESAGRGKERKGLLGKALSLSGRRQGRRGKRGKGERAEELPAAIGGGVREGAGPAGTPGETAVSPDAPSGGEDVPSPGVAIGEIPMEEIASTLGGEPGFEEPEAPEAAAGEGYPTAAEGEAVPYVVPADVSSMGEVPGGGVPSAEAPEGVPFEPSLETEVDGASMSVEEIGDFLGSIDTEKEHVHEDASSMDEVSEEEAFTAVSGAAGKTKRSGLLAKAAAYAGEVRGRRARVKKPSPARTKPSKRAPKAVKGAAAAVKIGGAAAAGVGLAAGEAAGKAAGAAPSAKKAAPPTRPAPSKAGRERTSAEREEFGRAASLQPEAGRTQPVGKGPLYPAPRAWEGDFAGKLARAVGARDSLAVVELFNAVIDREGHASFILRLLDAMAKSGKGKSAHLFVPSKGRYAVEFSAPDPGKKGAARKASFPQSSRFVEALREAGLAPVRSKAGDGSRKAQQLKKDTARLGPLAPWTAVSLPVGGELVAFAVVGKQPQRPKIDATGLVYLGRLAAPYVNKYLLTISHRRELAALEGEMREREGVLALYSSFDRCGDLLPDQLVKLLLEGISSSFGIESAVVLADWRSRSAYLPVTASGVPDKALARYRLSKRDAVLRAIVETGKPAIPPDSERRVAALLKEREAWLETYVVVPIKYGGEPVGLLVVHRMKGAGKKLSEKNLERMAHAARVLSPALLFGKLHAMSPFQVLDGLVARELLRAEKERHELAVSVFTLEGAKEAFKGLGFDRYWAMVERLRKVAERRAGSSGVVREIDWNRVALLMREDGGPGVEETVAGVRVDFLKGLTKSERAQGVELSSRMTRYPRESGTPSEILYALT